MLSVEVQGGTGGIDLELSLEAHPGACLAIAGPSGAGKTTALRIIAGLARPDRGHVRCGDEVWLDTERGIDLPPERRRCGYMFQDYALFPRMRAWQNVAYGLEGVTRGERRAAAERHLGRFGVADLAEARPGRLSGGERQRVALARTLASSPRALLLDEPLSALDARSRPRAARELAEILAELSVPTLLVTHDFGEAALLGDQVAVLDGGRVVQRGTAEELAAGPRSAFVADLTGAVVLSGVARPQADGLTAIDLDGGGRILSVDHGSGPTAVSVYPWEIELEPSGREHVGSAQNRLPAEVRTVTSIGGRVRVGLAASQALTADVTPVAVRKLGLVPGRRVTAVWKAAATRIVSTVEEPG
jgi:molybdate transport system ATP-binding protein